MNTDIRLSISFWDHPKTVKLERRLGLAGVKSLIILWMWAAANKPDGSLTNRRRNAGETPAMRQQNASDSPAKNWRPFGEEDIEIAARWNGEQNLFANTLVDLGWLDKIDGGYLIHGWSEHNLWAAEADFRGDKARFSRLAQVAPETFKLLKEQGVKSISKEDFGIIICETRARRRRNAGVSPAPSPSPSPALLAECIVDDISSTADEQPVPPPLTKKRFVPPTIDEVEAYCLERKNGVDIQRWFDHYTSNGWRVGKNPMKDWKAAVRTWEGKVQPSGYQVALNAKIPMPVTVNDALVLQRNEIARTLNDLKAQQRADAGCGENGGVLVESPVS